MDSIPFSRPPDTDIRARNFLVFVLLIFVLIFSCMVMTVINGLLILRPAGSELGLPDIEQSVIAFTFVAMLIAMGGGWLLTKFTKKIRHRAMGKTLLWACGLSAVLTLPRLFLPLDAIYTSSLLRIAIGGIFAFYIIRQHHRQFQDRPSKPWGKLPIALMVGFAMIVPFAINGALGSVLDTLRALVEAMVLGLITAACTVLLRPALEEDDAGITSVGGAGLTLTIALVLICGVWGQGDLNFLLVFAVAWLGRLIAALAKTSGNFTLPEKTNWLAPTTLVACVAFGTLAFADPTEFNIMTIIERYTGQMSLRATIIAFAIALTFGTLMSFIAKQWHTAKSLPFWLIAIMTMAGAVTAYTRWGKPGFFPDDYLIILKSQADLNTVPKSGDPAARRKATYNFLTQHALQTQQSLREDLTERQLNYTPYYIVNAIDVTTDAWTAWRLSQRSDVDRVLLSPELRRYFGTYETREGGMSKPNFPTWGVRYINADKVWNDLKIRGKGIVVASSDSGVDWQHPALRDQYRGKQGDHNYNWLDPWQKIGTPYDESGHGTHTTGTAVGSDGIGVAPDAEWYACANLVRNYGNPAYYLGCMQFTLAPHPHNGDPFTTGRPELGADISTNSWGCPPIEGCDLRVLEPGVQALQSAGIFAVFAAGNEGPSCTSLKSPPALYAESFVVGAIDSKGNLTDFSSRGPNSALPTERMAPDVLAPGAGVISAWPQGGYYAAEGTSMATPHVAGVVALMWSANPKLRGNVAQTAKILTATAKPYRGETSVCSNGAVPDPASGYGVVDALAAVQAALKFIE
jgi:subtilisin family serine protease